MYGFAIHRYFYDKEHKKLLTYAQAEELVYNSKSWKKKLENNTVLVSGAGKYYIKLHEHTIIIIYRDGTYKLDSCGFQTMLTRDRLSKYSPVNIYNKRGKWICTKGYGENEGDFPFYDGIIIDYNGNEITKEQ